MARFCASCGAPLADAATFCSGCGAAASPSAPSGPVAASAPSASGLTDNVAGMLAYITIIPAIIFLVLEPYNKKPFVRFHAFQCIFLALASFALGIVLMIIGMLPVIGLAMLFIAPLIWLGVLVLAIICLLKAYQGQMWKLPFIGDLAEKQANA